MMRPTSTNTPGILGYLGGVVVAGLVFGTLLVAPGLQFYDAVDAVAVLVLYIPLGAVGVLTVGAVVWLPGLVVLHLTCRRARNQAVHIAVAAVLASAAVLVLVVLTRLHTLGEGGPAYLVLAAGVAAAVGRAAVVPLVESRRRLAAAGHLTGTARW